jgi:hypothetical protein
MKIALAMLTSLVIWFTAAVPASAADPALQGLDEAFCKLFPWACPR